MGVRGERVELRRGPARVAGRGRKIEYDAGEEAKKKFKSHDAQERMRMRNGSYGSAKQEQDWCELVPKDGLCRRRVVWCGVVWCGLMRGTRTGTLALSLSRAPRSK